MRYWFDCEFDEDGRTIDLISIGIVAEDGRQLYRVSSEFDVQKCDPWVASNVISKLPSAFQTELVKTKTEIRQDVLDFFAGDVSMELWSYFRDYDWVAFCQLFGKMIDLPSTVPQYCMDLKQLRIDKGHPKLPLHLGNHHVAIDDAIWHRDVYTSLYFLPFVNPRPRWP